MNWRAQRAVYFALKQNPEIENYYPAYSTFISENEGGNIGKLYQVTVALNAARNGNDALRNNATNNRILIGDMLSQIETADQTWQNAVTTAEKDAAKEVKQQKLGELILLLENAANFQAAYQQSLINELTVAQQINSSISNTNEWEGYEKTVNAAFISYLQNGTLTETQQEDMKTIAELCPKIGGMAVYKARSILPECARVIDRDNRDGCYPIQEPITPTPTFGSTERSTIKNVTYAQVVPNPATEVATVFVPSGKLGNVRLYNAFGRLVAEQQMIVSQTIFGIAMLSSGIYYFEITYPDGQRECLKLVVSK